MQIWKSGNLGRANLEIWNLETWIVRIWNLESGFQRFQISRFAGFMFPGSRFPDLHDLGFQIPDFQICTTYVSGFPSFQISRNLESGNIGRANLEIWKPRSCKSGNRESGNLDRANLESGVWIPEIPDFQICRPYVSRFQISRFARPRFPDSRFCTTYVSGFQVSRFPEIWNLET